MRSLRKYAMLGLGLLPIAVLVVAWLLDEWSGLGSDWIHLSGALGNLVAMVGLCLLVVMVALGTRFPPIERLWGLDKVMRFHKGLAKAVIALLAAHALLKTLRFTLVENAGWQWGVLFSFNDTVPMILGRLALYGLVIAPLLAVTGALGVPFRLWKAAHFALYPVVALGLVHAKLRGNDFSRAPYNLIWYSLLCEVLLVVGYRGLYLLFRSRRFVWSVSETISETHDTTSLVLQRNLGPGSFARRRAGQFALLRVKQRFGWGPPHPFTISCAPSDAPLRFTIKRAGRFTGAVPALPRGKPILCEGPYGVFCPEIYAEKDIVLLAGGVGITPFLSALRHAVRVHSPARITLIWGNKTPADVIARDELARLTEALSLRVVHVFSHDADDRSTLPQTGRVAYEKGYVTVALLKKHLQAPSALYYYCGPPGMTRAVLSSLKEAFGVKARDVKRERFFF